MNLRSSLLNLLLIPSRATLLCAKVLHWTYKRTLSPILGNVCRFEPSCSDYAVEALELHGILKGSWLTITRVSRCNPFCEGGADPVPPSRHARGDSTFTI